MKSKQLSVIIAAHNEEKSVRSVLNSIKDYPSIKEIIIISDGSNDNTVSEIRKVESPKIKLIVFRKNRGKSAAIVKGFKEASSKYILFLDSDLFGITFKDLDTMVMPVFNDDVDLTFANFSTSLWLYKIFQCDFISGLRCIRKKDFANFFKGKFEGYALEVLMNDYALSNKLRIKNVNVSFGGITKVKKRGFFLGWKHEFFMMRQITDQYSFWKLVRQFFLLLMEIRKYR